VTHILVFWDETSRMSSIFGSMDNVAIVGLAWGPLSETQRIEFLFVNNGSTDPWPQITPGNS
jgi:hypothetical protein